MKTTLAQIARKLRKTLRGRTPFFQRPGAAPAMPLLAASDLEHAFQKERARVDRNGRGCALVAFQIESPVATARDRVVDLLRRRCRLSDTLGKLDPQLLVALLPETTGEKAWFLADDVRDQARTEGIQVQCEIFCYPKDWTPGGPHSGASTRIREGSASSGSLAEFERVIGKPEAARNGNPASTEAANGTIRRRRAEEETTVLTAEAIPKVKPSRPVHDVRPLIQHPIPIWKRLIDIAVSSVLLVLLSPLFFVVALAVKATSPGPVIFRQRRVGEGGRPFMFFKFRSMYQDAEQRKQELMSENEADGPVFKIRNDPRLTAIGKLLRSTSVDELPQLWNVLKGDMTLVGPRPPTADEVPGYELWQLHRLATRGGITCIWQVSGRSDIKFMEWARMDLRYLATKSFWTDLGLLWQTMSAVLSRKGAY